ncbi:MAG: GPR endopeptidase [Hungatella sp.]|nr:GPR endopeptidase [Hungatella sp.]
MFEIRTDLAVEEKESFPGKGTEVTGVSLREWRKAFSKIKLTEVAILDEHGAKAMGKPKGTYITMEAKALAKGDEDYHREVSGELAVQLKRMVKELKRQGEVPDRENIHVLAVGLGNPSVTPDALGPKVLGNLKVNRNITEEKTVVLSGIVPGVMAQTGMETAEILKGILHETKPDLVVAVDALAARSIRRLGTTLQLTNTGIHPGSGVGNHRHSLTKESLGIPVLAIGVPTVVGAAAIVHDTISTLIQTLASHAQTEKTGEFLEQLSPEEQYQLICELLEPEFGALYVTPPDIDQTVKRLSYTISEGIHMAFYPKWE